MRLNQKQMEIDALKTPSAPITTGPPPPMFNTHNINYDMSSYPIFDHLSIPPRTEYDAETYNPISCTEFNQDQYSNLNDMNDSNGMF